MLMVLLFYDAEDGLADIINFGVRTDASECQDVITTGKPPSRYVDDEGRTGLSGLWLDPLPAKDRFPTDGLQHDAIIRIAAFS